MFSVIVNIIRAQEKIKDGAAGLEEEHEVITEQIMPSDETVELFTENFTVNTNNDSIINHSLRTEDEGEFVDIVFH